MIKQKIHIHRGNAELRTTCDTKQESRYVESGNEAENTLAGTLSAYLKNIESTHKKKTLSARHMKHKKAKEI